MKAIVYVSNTGHTAGYAKLLSEKTGLPAYEAKEAKAALAAGSQILFMGWIMAGGVQGLKQALKRYSVRGVCAVGMAEGGEQAKEISERYDMGNRPVFYIAGGFEMNKLRGIYKIMMQTMARSVGKKLQEKPDKTPEDEDNLYLLTVGEARIREENLKAVLDWLQ